MTFSAFVTATRPKKVRTKAGELRFSGHWDFSSCWTFCCLALVKHLKGDQTLDLSGSRLWDDPCRVEVLNRLQTWDNRGFQAGRCKDDEIVSECRILWFIICKIQIEIDECGHQICFSCTHREAEQIISVGYIEKKLLGKMRDSQCLTDSSLSAFQYLRKLVPLCRLLRERIQTMLLPPDFLLGKYESWWTILHRSS